MKYAVILLLLTTAAHAADRKTPRVATEEAADLNMDDIRKFLRRYYAKRALFDAEARSRK